MAKDSKEEEANEEQGFDLLKYIGENGVYQVRLVVLFLLRAVANRMCNVGHMRITHRVFSTVGDVAFE